MKAPHLVALLLFSASLFSQPYLGALDAFMLDLRKGEPGVSADLAAVLNEQRPGSSAQVELSHNTVYYHRGSDLNLGLLLADPQGFRIVGLRWKEVDGHWQAEGIDQAPFPVNTDSLRNYLRGFRRILYSAKEAFFGMTGPTCDCPNESSLDFAYSLIYGSEECLSIKTSLPWTYKTVVYAADSRWDQSLECFIEKPGAIEDWTKAKPELLKQLLVLEYALASAGKARAIDQSYMERFGLGGERVLSKTYEGDALHNEWRLHINYEYFGEWRLSWKLERHIGETVKEKFTPVLDLQKGGLCLSGDCQNGEGKMQFENPKRTYTGNFQAGLASGSGSLLLEDGVQIFAHFQAGTVRDSAIYRKGEKQLSIYAPNSKARWVRNFYLTQYHGEYTGPVNYLLQPIGKGFLKGASYKAWVSSENGSIKGADSAVMEMGDYWVYSRLNTKLQPDGKVKLIAKDGSKNIRVRILDGQVQWFNVEIYWGQDSAYFGATLPGFIPHGEGLLRKGGQEQIGDWYNGKYVGSTKRYLEDQKRLQAEAWRKSAIDAIYKYHELGLRSQQLYAGPAKPEIQVKPKNGFQLSPQFSLWNISDHPVEVEIIWDRPGLLGDVHQIITIPSVKEGLPMKGGNLEFYNLQYQFFKIKMIEGSYKDLYLVIL